MDEKRAPISANSFVADYSNKGSLKKKIESFAKSNMLARELKNYCLESLFMER